MGLLYRKGSRAAPAQKIEKELTIVNRLGLHARPAAMFVRIASRHRAEIWVSKEGEEVNGKSIMGLMMLAAGRARSCVSAATDQTPTRRWRSWKNLSKRDSTKTDSPDVWCHTINARRTFVSLTLALLSEANERQPGNPV